MDEKCFSATTTLLQLPWFAWKLKLFLFVHNRRRITLANCITSFWQILLFVTYHSSFRGSTRIDNCIYWTRRKRLTSIDQVLLSPSQQVPVCLYFYNKLQMNLTKYGAINIISISVYLDSGQNLCVCKRLWYGIPFCILTWYYYTDVVIGAHEALEHKTTAHRKISILIIITNFSWRCLMSYFSSISSHVVERIHENVVVLNLFKHYFDCRSYGSWWTCIPV